MFNPAFLKYYDKSMDELSLLVPFSSTTSSYSPLSFFDSSFVNVSSVATNFSNSSSPTFYSRTSFNTLNCELNLNSGKRLSSSLPTQALILVCLTLKHSLTKRIKLSKGPVNELV